MRITFSIPVAGRPSDVSTVPLMRTAFVGFNAITRSLSCWLITDREPLRFGRLEHARKEHRRVRRLVLTAVAEPHVRTPGGLQVVLARRDAEQAELAVVVGGRLPAGAHERALALDELISHRRDHDVRQRLAELVEDAPGDHRAARQAEIHALHGLSVFDLQRGTGLERARLPVRQRDVAALRCIDRVAAGFHFLELVPAVVVCGREAVLPDLSGENPYLRLSKRPARVRGQHVAAQRRRARLFNVGGRQLTDGEERDEDEHLSTPLEEKTSARATASLRRRSTDAARHRAAGQGCPDRSTLLPARAPRAQPRNSRLRAL